MTQPQQSNAERFVQELQLEANVQEPEESLVVGSIDELRTRLAALQAEVRAAAAAAASCVAQTWRSAPHLQPLGKLMCTAPRFCLH